MENVDEKKTSNDVELGLKQQYIQSKHFSNNNENETTNNNSDNNEKSPRFSSEHSVCLIRAAKTVVLLLIITVCSIITFYMGWIYGLQAIFVAIIAILIASGKWRWFYIAAVTLPRDTKAVHRFIKLLFSVKQLSRKDASIDEVFAIQVAKTPDKACFTFEGREWTFKEIYDFSNRIANVFYQHGYKNGDKVGLLMENRPEFVAAWLGLSKIGVVVPLINHNLKKQSLLHSITISSCNALIFGESLIESVSDIQNQLPSSLSLYQFNDDINLPCHGNSKDLQTLMSQVPRDPPTGNIKKPGHHDELLYIFTSGTTGLPKAAVITHSRYIYIASAIHFVAAFKKDDVFYTPLPLYHTAGGVMSIGQALIFGSTIVIRKKFSASAFFTDCAKYKCTIGQYIGEMCRYCLATPGQPTDTTHNLRLLFGNGLRPQIWPQFVKRFNIPSIAEFYGATEGNANILNVENVVGSIGFISRIIPAVYPISIIKADPNTGEPIRGKDGLCQLCEPNEPGVFIGKIIPNNPSRAFLGYVDKKASDKKIVHDVFKKGDSAFLSGDILIADERGNLFFKDRTGDTFRWKGENCSTSEIEAQVSNEAGYRDTVVYGVEIPNLEGRAGMAAILDSENNLDLQLLGNNLRKALPAYALPQFIRLLVKVDMTGTCKLIKLDLQKEGYNPSLITDKLYYLNNKTTTYEPLTVEVYAKIQNQEMRF